MNDTFSKKITRRNVLKTTVRFCFRVGMISLFLDGFQTQVFGDPAAIISNKQESDFEPAYLALHRTGELKQRANLFGPSWRIAGFAPGNAASIG